MSCPGPTSAAAAYGDHGQCSVLGGMVQAKEELVQSYKKLRTEDAAPGSSTAYRITVRQLEALVRLSEAIARAACNHQIVPEYVQEVSISLPPDPVAADKLLEPIIGSSTGPCL